MHTETEQQLKYNIMKETTLKAIKQGEFYKLKPTETAPVWVRGYYVREEKKYESYLYDDTNRESFKKGNTKVWIDFEF